MCLGPEAEGLNEGLEQAQEGSNDSIALELLQLWAEPERESQGPRARVYSRLTATTTSGQGSKERRARRFRVHY